MARVKKLTDYTYSPTNPSSEDAIREQIDDAIQEVYDDSTRVNDTVDLTTDQTIAGIKTFSSSPIIPQATTDNQPMRKVDIDNKNTSQDNDINARALDSETVHTIGDETISGIKSFNSLPTVPLTPTNGNEISSKKYVDDSILNIAVGELPLGSVTDEYLGSDNKVGSLATLDTTDKTNVVNAINEVKGDIIEDADGINVTDANNIYSGTTVEEVLIELGASIPGVVPVSTTVNDLSATVTQIDTLVSGVLLTRSVTTETSATVTTINNKIYESDGTTIKYEYNTVVTEVSDTQTTIVRTVV